MDKQNRIITAPREPLRGIDHITLALGGIGLIIFWVLIGLLWVES